MKNLRKIRFEKIYKQLKTTKEEVKTPVTEKVRSGFVESRPLRGGWEYSPGFFIGVFYPIIMLTNVLELWSSMKSPPRSTVQEQLAS